MFIPQKIIKKDKVFINMTGKGRLTGGISQADREKIHESKVNLDKVSEKENAILTAFLFMTALTGDLKEQALEGLDTEIVNELKIRIDKDKNYNPLQDLRDAASRR